MILQKMWNLDRRESRRVNLNKRGLVRVSNIGSFFCHVKDISDRGAMLIFVDPVIFPKNILLFIPEDEFHAECDVVHQNGRRLGLRFLTNRYGAYLRYG